MKKLLTLALTIICIFTNLVACNNSNPSNNSDTTVVLETCTETLVVIKVITANKNTTAIELLTQLQNDGELTFTSFDGGYGAYVTSINGKSEVVNGTTGYSWMLYTSDEEFSSTEFGSLTYYGSVFGQAALGASYLKVKADKYYIWAYESWSY